MKTENLWVRPKTMQHRNRKNVQDLTLKPARTDHPAVRWVDHEKAVRGLGIDSRSTESRHRERQRSKMPTTLVVTKTTKTERKVDVGRSQKTGKTNVAEVETEMNDV